jgi:hypothetical protein
MLDTPEQTAGQTPDQVLARLEAAFPMPVDELRRYEARRWILGLVPPGGVGAEIGVFRGHFSELICAIARPRRLYLIDPWRILGAGFGWSDPYTNEGRLTTDAARTEALARVARHPATEVIAHEGYYPLPEGAIPEPLDFAYLDASHQYRNTLNELYHLDRQVAPDGLILGDDWAPDPGARHHGVFRAVQEFVGSRDWQVLAAGPGGQWALRRRPAYG